MTELYLFGITLGLLILYFILFYFLPYFFDKPGKKIKLKKAGISISLLVIVSLISYLVSFSLTDVELGNRILHIFGGGFTAFLLCFLVVKDLNLQINKIQFLTISALIVIALGVSNELAEFFLQSNFNHISSHNTEDTWRDLTSNLVGILLASIIFTPLLNTNKKL